MVQGLLTKLTDWFYTNKSDSYFTKSRLDQEDIEGLRSSCKGELQKLFYFHDGRVVHKWLHYLDIYEK